MAVCPQYGAVEDRGCHRLTLEANNTLFPFLVLSLSAPPLTLALTPQFTPGALSTDSLVAVVNDGLIAAYERSVSDHSGQ